MSDGDRSFRWEQLDQCLLRPKLEELSEEMQKRSMEATNKASYDTRESGNTAGYFPRLFEAQRQLTDEWAQKLYDVHCEVWGIQGQKITGDFIRAVSQTAITALIVTRKGTVEHGAELWSKRTRHEGAHIPLRMWTQMITKLRAEWMSKLEAEAVANEHRSRIESTKPKDDVMADPVDSSFRKRVAITNAPPPPTILSGTSWIPRQPKPTVPLDGLPPYYPASLTTKTDLVICEAVKKFPVQTHVVEFCKYVLTKLKPDFLEVIKRGELKQNLALTRMRELLHSLLVYNCDSDSRRFEFEGELSRSTEWFKLAKGVARVSATPLTGMGRPLGLQTTSLLRFRESALNLLSKELRTFRESLGLIFVRIPFTRSGINESETPYAEALHRLRDSKNDWKESSLSKIKVRVGDLFNLAAEFQQPNPEQWATLAARGAIQREFPTTRGGYTNFQDRAINTWLSEQLQEFIDEAAIQQLKRASAAQETGNIFAGLAATKNPSSTGPVAVTAKVKVIPATRYRSPLKRLIAIQLGQTPDATDLEICRAIDADGGSELPAGWKSKPEDRLFENAYKDDARRNRVQAAISKIRADLRRLGVVR